MLFGLNNYMNGKKLPKLVNLKGNLVNFYFARAILFIYLLYLSIYKYLYIYMVKIHVFE